MLKCAVEIFKVARETHADLYQLVCELRRELCPANGGKPIGDLVDTSYALREALRYLDDIGKELRQLKELAEKMTCLLWVQSIEGGSVYTEHCTALPKVAMIASIPKRSTAPALHARMMTSLNVPINLWIDQDIEEIVRVHWPGFVSHITRLAQAGKPLPDGIDIEKTYPRYSVTVRRKKEVDE